MPKEVFAFRNNIKNIKNATSGGAFIALSEAFFKIHTGNKIHVYGTIYDQQLNVLQIPAHLTTHSAKN